MRMQQKLPHSFKCFSHVNSLILKASKVITKQGPKGK